MSLILKGIDIPKEYTRVIAITPNGEVWQINPIRKNERLEAEAIQIPKGHGRLIDGDKLCYEFIDWQYTEAPDHLNTEEGRMVTDHERQYEVYLALGEAVIKIAKAPTILEAEE